jgi:hypothetical protein
MTSLPRRFVATAFAALALWTMAPPAALAQDGDADTLQARRAEVHRMVELAQGTFDPRAIVKSMTQSMQTAVLQGLRERNPQLPPAQLQRAAEVLGTSIGEAVAEFGDQMIPRVYDQMETLFASRLNLAELQELNRYYANPTVRKAMDITAKELPALMQPMMAELQQHMLPAVQTRMAAAVKQLKAEGIALR